jgi:folate-dependent phosphoribosylglycinamide formyltransferase PurN
MSAVVVFSPSRFSLYTICVTELLKRNNIQVKAIFVRRLFNPDRFFSELSRDGSRLLKKIWKKLVLRENAYRTNDYETIADFMRKENIGFKSVDDFKDKYGIPIVYCNDLNDSIVVEGIKKAKPDLVVFTGGGLIRQDILENSGAGILNCHMGVLPHYRGMDVIEWPILENNPQEIGMTVHFMDKGVDTGDILRVRKVEIASNESIKQIRERFEPIMCREMVAACLDYLEGKLQRIPQKQKDGRQYFVMHPRLIELAESKLKSQTPG